MCANSVGNYIDCSVYSVFIFKLYLRIYYIPQNMNKILPNFISGQKLAHVCGKHGTVVTPKMYGKVKDYQCYDCLRMFASKESKCF